MMVINKNSWHARLWQWSFKINDNPVPKQANLCSYVQRLFWTVMLAVLGYVVAFPIYIWWGRPTLDLKNDSPIVRWPDLKVGETWVATPWLLLPVLLGLLEWLSWSYRARDTLIIHLGIGFGVVILGLIVLISGFTAGAFDSNETVKLVRSWLSAKKQGICPLIEFKGEPTSNDEDDEDDQCFSGGRMI